MKKEKSSVWIEDAATGTQGFGASRSSDGLCVLAFRGTEPTRLTDLGADLAFTLTDWTEKAGRVHKGFAGAARSRKRRPMSVDGHGTRRSPRLWA